jgi:hypothetical protein
MLKACPSFLPRWNACSKEHEEFLGELGGDCEFPYYLALSELASHIWRLTLAQDQESLKPVFGVIESWLVNGDDYVRLACSVGVLERVKCAKKASPPTRQFRDALGPVSRKEWDGI